MSILRFVEKISLIVLSISGLMWSLFGLAFAFLNQSPVMAPVMKQLFGPFLGTTPLVEPHSALVAFICGIIGAVMASWALFLELIIWNALKKDQKWAWWTILLSVLVWFAIDESFSIYYKVDINVMGNIVLLAGFLLLLISLAICRKLNKNKA